MLFYGTKARNIASSIDISAKKSGFDKFGASELFMLAIDLATKELWSTTDDASSHQNDIVEDVNDTVIGLDVGSQYRGIFDLKAFCPINWNRGALD